MLLYRFALGNSKTLPAKLTGTTLSPPSQRPRHIHGEHGIQLIAPEKQTFL